MKKLCSNFLIVLVLLLPVRLLAQQYNFQQYSVNKGLPHTQVHDVFQTCDGFIWLGTFGGGLVKFDGHSFKIFDAKDGLRNNIIEVVFEDSRHNLWVSTLNNGVARMEEDRFIYPFKGSELDSLSVIAIEEIDSKLWFGTDGEGFFVYNYKDKTFSKITEKDGLVNNTVWDFWKAPDGKIWIATQGGISVYDGSKFRNITSDDGLSGNKTFKVAAQANGDIWIGTNNGITVWDGKEYIKLSAINDVPLNYVYDLIVTEEGSTWIATELAGVFVFKDGKFTHYKNKNGLSSNNIYELYEDKRNNVWIATNSDGVNILKGKMFQFYGTESGLASTMVLSLQKDKEGRIWAGTYDGIFYEEEGENFNRFPLPEKYEDYNEIWDIAKFKNGDLLFLMPDNVLYKWDGVQLTNYSKKHGLDDWFTYDIYVDKSNTLWIGTDEGLFHYSNGNLEVYTEEDGLAGNVTKCIFELGGYYWIGTMNGLSRFDGSSFENLSVEEGLRHKQVTHIAADEKGNIWLGTGGGVTFLELNGKYDVVQVQNFGNEAGMKLVKTQIVWFDAAGHLWHGTNGGIHRLNVPFYYKTGNMSITHYPLSDTGIGVETNHKAVLPISENKALFGTMNGILKISPSLSDRNASALPVYITQVEDNSKPLKSDTTTDSIKYKFGRKLFSSLNFPYGQHSYTFHYTALEFKNPASVRYRYRLKGFDKKWTIATFDMSATFTNLDPGSYTFEVQAKSRQEGWKGAKKAALTLSVDNPYWQTYWFYGFIFVTFIGLVYGSTQLRMQMLEKKRLKELVDDQTKDLTLALEEKEVLIKEIHHRVKNNLAVISGLLELQVGYSEDDFAAKVLKESQRRVKSIAMIHEKLYQNERLSEINFVAYIDELIDIIADSLSHPDKNIEVKTNIDDVKLDVNQGIPCGLILNELLSNTYEHAFKNQKEGRIIIEFREKEGGEIRFSVEDNGSGLPDDFENHQAETKSLGLILVETLTQQLEGTLTINRLDKGTRFAVKFEKEKELQKLTV